MPDVFADAVADQATLQGFNLKRVLSQFFEHNRLSRRQIGTLTGLSKPTVSQLLARLEASGIVVCVGESTDSAPGPNPQLYELNCAAVHIAGVDTSGRDAIAAVADLGGRVIGWGRAAIDANDPVSSIKRAVDAAAAAAGTDTRGLAHTVVGVPAAVDPRTGMLAYAARKTSWVRSDLRGALRSTLGAGVTLENNVNLSAVAEQFNGCAVGYRDFVVLWVGSGIGLAVVIGGNLHRGAAGAAGEIGSGRIGRVGAPGGGLSGDVALATDHALHDDPVFRAGFVEGIAAALATVSSVLDPQLIVLSGEVFRMGTVPLSDLIESRLHTFDAPHPAIVLSTVEGNAVVNGAIRMALRSVRSTILDAAPSGRSWIARGPLAATGRR